MPVYNLQFPDYDETGFLIKFGHKEYLEQIMNGKVRFTSLKTYQKIENPNIGDNNEGVRTILHQDGNLKITYSNPIFKGGREIDFSSNITSFKDFPDNNKYISCFSYLTQKTIIENDIVSKVLLSEPEWNDVLLILDTTGFITDLMKILSPYSLRYGRVKYLDYSENQMDLNEFTKSKKYEHQKEQRFSIVYNNQIDSKIRIINSEILEVDLGKTYLGDIIPITEFTKCFTINKN